MGNLSSRNPRAQLGRFPEPRLPAVQNVIPGPRPGTNTPPYGTQNIQLGENTNTNTWTGQPYNQQPLSQQPQQLLSQQPQQPYNQLTQQSYAETLAARGYLPGNQPPPYGAPNLASVYGQQQMYPSSYYQQQPQQSTGCPTWAWCLGCLASLWCCQPQNCSNPTMTDPISNPILRDTQNPIVPNLNPIVPNPNPIVPNPNPTVPNTTSTTDPSSQTPPDKPDDIPDKTNDDLDDNDDDYDSGSYDD